MDETSGKIKRNRGKNFTDEECLQLLQILLHYKNVIESKTTNAITNKEKTNAWHKVMTKYNATAVTKRCIEQLQSKYENLKNSARKYACQKKKNFIETGGGPPDTKDNPIFDFVLEIINLKTVYGEENPYDDDEIFINDNNNSNIIVVSNGESNVEGTDYTESVAACIADPIVEATTSATIEVVSSTATTQKQVATTQKNVKKKQCNASTNLLKLSTAKEEYFVEKTKQLKDNNEQERNLNIQLLQAELKRKMLINQVLEIFLMYIHSIFEKFLSK